MNDWSVAVLLLAGINLYMGLHYFWFYLKSREHKEYLSFAMMCISISFYDVFCSNLYSVTVPAEAGQWQKWQFVSLSFVSIFSIAFVSDFINRKKRIVDYFLYIEK